MDFLGRMAQVANAPVYGLWENLLGHGIVGGHLMSFRAQGQKAAELGRRVLLGEKPENIPVVYVGTNFYLFDWRQLKRWGLPETALPVGSEVRFREDIGMGTLQVAYYRSFFSDPPSRSGNFISHS